MNLHSTPIATKAHKPFVAALFPALLVALGSLSLYSTSFAAEEKDKSKDCATCTTCTNCAKSGGKTTNSSTTSSTNTTTTTGSSLSSSSSSTSSSSGSSLWNWTYNWTFNGGDGERVKGSGNAITDKRQIGGYVAIVVDGAAKVRVRQGATEAVTVTGDDNIVPLIETKVIDTKDGATLRIGPKKGVSFRTNTPVEVTLDVLTLQSISIPGSGDVQMDALNTKLMTVNIRGSGDVRFGKLTTDSLAVSITGSGDVSATGRAQKLFIDIRGSGDVRTESLDAEDVSVRIAGSGDAAVRASKTLNVSVAGSGDVVYSGEGVLTKSIAGSGSVRKR